MPTISLTSDERAMLAGDEGVATQLAARLIVRMAELMGAERLVPIASAPVDGCLYHGPVSIDFAERLVVGGGSVRVETTLNVGMSAADVSQLADTSSSAPKPAAPSIDGLANENTFLQLLVAQIKNQDPLQPADSIQFLSQLAQFSQLEQLIGIRQELKTQAAADTSGDSSTGTAATTN